MEFRILGPLEVIDGDRPLELGTAKERALLGLLLLRANRAVSVDQLGEELWAGEPPARASATLRVHVSHLRKALGGGDGVVVTRRPGYLVQAGPDDLDATRFERLAATGREQLAAGDAEAARHSLDEALALWRGPVLADLELSEADHPELARLAEARLAATEDRIEAALACGRHAEVVGELEGLVAEHPLRERLWGQRMLALYRSGRQAEALRCYQELRTSLGEELGIDPSPALQQLEEAILLQKPELELGAKREVFFPPAVDAPLPSGPVTFFLTDIAGSTALWERHPDAMAEALSRHDTLISTVVDKHSGHLVKKRGEGDATFSVFVRPSDAVAAAVEAQRVLLAEAWPAGLSIRVRAALHTGEAELRDDDYFGGVVNRAARLRGVAHGEQIIVSAATAELVRDSLPDGVSLRDLGTHRLRDLSRPERIWQVDHPDLPAKFPPLKSLDALPTNLPATTTSFIGREQELARVAELLGLSRLVTLTGPGGSGKTRLSLRAGADAIDRFPDGVWLVELAPVGEDELVIHALSAALGISEQAGQNLLDIVVSDLASKQVLLILDNCEHVLSAAAAVVDTLLRACPHLTVLATSRERLNIAGESTWPVPPLDVPDDNAGIEDYAACEAIRLFVDRAVAVRPAFVLDDENAASVIEICRRLDGIPLAIELAAARVALLTPAQIAERLEDRFRLLTSGSRAALPRQQTLRALIDWSYDLLSPDEQVLFRRLGVFRGGFTLDVAEDVTSSSAGERAAVFDALGQLVEKSLVVVDHDATPPRYRMLETVREYAEDRLAEVDELERWRRAHAHWCVAFVERLVGVIPDENQGAALRALEQEHDNLRAALDWCVTVGDGDLAVRLVAHLWSFWYVRGHWAEARRWIRLSLEAAQSPAPADCAFALAAASLFAAVQGDVHEGREQGIRAVEAAEAAGDERARAMATLFLGHAEALGGDRERSMELDREVISMSEAAGLRLPASLARMFLAGLRMIDGLPDDHPESPRRLLSAVLDDARARGDAWLASQVLDSIVFAGDDEGVRRRLEEGLELARELGDPVTEADLTSKVAQYAVADGDWETAEHLLEQSIALNRRLRRTDPLGGAMIALATLQRLRGARAATEALIDELEGLQASGSGPAPHAELSVLEEGVRGLVAWQRGLIELDVGNLAAAATLLLTAVGHLIKSSPMAGIAARSIAVIGVRSGDPVRAARLYGLCEEGTADVTSWLPVARPDHERDVAELAAALPPEQFEAEKAKGKQMTIEEGTALAREIVARVTGAD